MAKYYRNPAARRCQCGRLKPGNRKFCYTCRPKRGALSLPETDEPYSLADCVAIARACGLSYGNLMPIMEQGSAPPLLRPVDWPEGSAHGK